MDAMDCPVEANLIRKSLRSMDGIDDLSFDFVDRVLTVRHRAAASQIEAKLAEIGMEPRLVTTADVSGSRSHASTAWLVGVSVGLGAVAELLEWMHEANPGFAGITPLHIAIASGCAVVLTFPPTLKKAWLALRGRTITISLLVSIAVVGAIAIGQYPEAAMAVSLFALSEAIEAASLRRAGNAIKSLLSSTPQTCEVIQSDTSVITVATNLVATGDRIRIRPGAIIPLDGTIIAGISEVDASALTGEPIPVTVTTGDTVSAGTSNTTGTFILEVTAAAGNTTMDRLIRSVREAAGDRATTERLVDRFAAIYTPAVVAMAFILGCIVPLVTGQPFIPWISKALVLLVIACPCALVISTPVTVVSALTAAARAGALVRSGRILESIAAATMVAFDKTGTLTTGKPSVTDIVPLVDGLSIDDALHLAASVNYPSEHPIGAAIVQHCATRHQCTPDELDTFEALIGRGVAASIRGQMHFIGSHRLVHDNDLCGDHVEAVLDRLAADGKTSVVLMSDRQALAVIAVQDAIRPETQAALERCGALGLKTTMLTGDTAAAATSLATSLHMQDVRAELLPLEKQDAVKQLQQGGEVVVMVGDGINDSAALAQSNIGMAMSTAATAVTVEIADVALLRADIRLVPELIHLSRMVRSTLWTNITIALAFKAVFFALALLGNVQLWMAVLADVGAALLVTLNGLRLLNARLGTTKS
jgi:Cd2+/Zn2+-exporting ATPase